MYKFIITARKIFRDFAENAKIIRNKIMKNYFSYHCIGLLHPDSISFHDSQSDDLT